MLAGVIFQRLHPVPLFSRDYIAWLEMIRIFFSHCKESADRNPRHPFASMQLF